MLKIGFVSQIGSIVSAFALLLATLSFAAELVIVDQGTSGQTRTEKISIVAIRATASCHSIDHCFKKT